VLVAVGAVTLGLHVAAVLLGVRVSPSQLRTASLTTIWQLLPVRVLRHNLLGGLAHLHSQPPLFNAFTGVLLQLPRATQASAADAGLLVSAIVVAVSTAGLMLEFRVRRALVLVLVGIFVVADPAQYLYATFYFYALPTAALATAMAWAAVRWVRTERVVPGAAFGVLAALLVLTNSSYQIYTVAIAAIPVIWVLRRRWHQVLAVLVAPLVVVGAWYLNDLVQFHTATTSSWLGMNLARSTLELDSRADLNALIHQGVLSPTARIIPFGYLGEYGPLGQHAPTGHPGLDQRLKLYSPNYNNVAYLGIARRYLGDDLAWVEHRPLQYLRHTTIGMRMWMLPTEQFYATVSSPHYHLGGYTTLYDYLPMLQLTADPYAVVAVINNHTGPSASNLSLTTLAMTLLGVFVLPFVAWRRRRTDRAAAAGALFCWFIVASVFATTTLIEAAENNRFRFELGGLPLVAATVAVAYAADRSGLGGGLLRRAGGEGDGGTGEALAVDDEPPRVAAGGLQGQRPEVDGHGDVDG